MMRIETLKRTRWPGLVVAATVVLALAVGLARPAGAATRFVATTGNNAGPNTCMSSGSPCKTITHALTQAVASDTISVAAGNYNLALGETFPLFISKSLTVTGTGAGSTIIDATGANTRVITIDFGVTATITGVTITGGVASCTSSGVSGCEFGGGGLSNFGSLTLTNSTVSGNTVSCTGSTCNAFGGGLRNGNNNTLTVTDVTVKANTVTCSGNGCTAEGGGLWNEGTMTTTASAVIGNTVSCNASGSDSCFAPGGGSWNGFGGTMIVTNGTVSGNTATCTNSGSGECDAAGGGLLNASSIDTTLTVMNSTVSGNTANCTKTGSGPCSAIGGALANARTMTVTNATLTANTVACSGTGCTAAGGGLYNGAGTATLQNTIVAKQLSGADCANSATLTSNGFNLAGDSTCQLLQPSDKPNVSNPLLGPLQSNGGPTRTHALLPGSQAINAGTNSGCPSTDQRGIARPQGATCDIGAFEFGAIVAAVELNGALFHTGQQITYQAIVNPGFTPTQVDIYLGSLLPNLATFLSLVQVSPGVISIALGPAPVPFLANVTLAPLAVPFAFTFTGAEPGGTYIPYAGLAVAGSNPFVPANQLSLAVQAFQFSP